MRQAAMTILVGTASAISFSALSHEPPAAPPPAPAPAAAAAMSPQQVVDARRAAMRLAAADIQLMRTAGEKGADIRPMSRAAQSLSEWGALLPTLFPAGTGPGVVRTRARTEIWSDRADFEQRARTFSEAAARLAAAAAAADMATGRMEWDAAWQGCNACHERYRGEASPSP